MRWRRSPNMWRRCCGRQRGNRRANRGSQLASHTGTNAQRGIRPGKVSTVEEGMPRARNPTESSAVRCASCESKEATKRLVEAAEQGRFRSQSADAQKRRMESNRRSAHALRDWNARDQPPWLTERFFAVEIQPRLTFETVARLASALSVSHPYASGLRAGKRRPHPRHWLTLARLVGIRQNQ